MLKQWLALNNLIQLPLTFFSQKTQNISQLTKARQGWPI